MEKSQIKSGLLTLFVDLELDGFIFGKKEKVRKPL